jgi:alkyldihydroxyacetonephosphate synthase
MPMPPIVYHGGPAPRSACRQGGRGTFDAIVRSGSVAPVAAAALPPPGAGALVAREALQAAVSGRLSFSELDRLSYARDLWPLALLWIRQGKCPPPPDAIAWPGSEDEVARLVGVAREHRLPLVPFGAGSGVCGGTWAVRGGVSMDLKRLDAIGEVDARRATVDVGAGVLGETLERHLAARGWTLGHFPSSIAMSTVGGWLATRSAGQFSSRYGKFEDMVLSLRAVTGRGQLVVTPERPFAGPDLAGLLMGSEGTLCCFTGARLRVFPAPAGRAFHGFDFPSVERGLDAIRRLFREGLRPAAVRLYDPFDTAFVGAGAPRRAPAVPPSARRELPRRLLRLAARHTLRRPAALNALQRLFRHSRLVLVFEGEAAQAQAEDRAAAVLCREQGAADLGEAPGRAWLDKRYAVSFKLSGLIDAGAFADTMEVAAPWERVHEVYEAVHRAASPWAFVLCHFSHAYAEGCSLYFSFVGSGADEAQLEERYHQLWQAALGAAVLAGGNVSHHHGVGLLKGEALQQALGEGRAALAALKELFDPDHVLNPGKLGLAA